WKHDLRNCWWVIDYNRQSLDSVVSDALFQKHADVFRALGWKVVTVKYGKRLQRAFEKPGGEALRTWIDDCPNLLYSALVFQGGKAWRNQLRADLANEPQTLEIIEDLDEEALHRLMTNLGGHDMESLVEAFESAPGDRPVCFIAYTVKGKGLPFQGHKDNHAGLMTKEQMERFRAANGIAPGEEWEPFAGLDDSDALASRLSAVPFNAMAERRLRARRIEVSRLPPPTIRGAMSTQEGYGKILDAVAREDTELADRIVTASPDVTVSTNLGPWVNRRAIFSRSAQADVFQERKLMSAQRWDMGPKGQHIELGIAENNLFLLLGAAGLSHSLFGERLLPIGVLYDPFIARGLDSLNYACYQDARFIVVGTPSGISLAPEGGAHQSVGTPLIGMSQDGLAAFEPSYVDELAVIFEWALDYIQREGKAQPGDWVHEREGGAVYLRLSTRPLDQPVREFDADTRQAIIQGGYWMRTPAEGAGLAVAYTGVAAPQAAAALGRLLELEPGAGLLAVTSADRLNAGWQAAMKARQIGEGNPTSHVEALLKPLARDARIVTVLDGHPATLSWLGAVHGHRTEALGVEHFGQAGTIPDLHTHYRIDTDAVFEAGLATLPKGRRR
ncbi:MAG TPA: transketolase, partial [Hyphomicrobiales bacterium]|nr:transketolase [Hyphomicrobiales bacterium]